MAIQFLRGNKSTLEASQQIFLPGQPIYEQDSGQLKIGNGSDIYSALKYVGASSSGGSEPGGVVISGDLSKGHADFGNGFRLSWGMVKFTSSPPYALDLRKIGDAIWTTDVSLYLSGSWFNPALDVDECLSNIVSLNMWKQGVVEWVGAWQGESPRYLGITPVTTLNEFDTGFEWRYEIWSYE